MEKKRTFEEIWDVIDISVYIIVGFGILEMILIYVSFQMAA